MNLEVLGKEPDLSKNLHHQTLAQHKLITESEEMQALSKKFSGCNCLIFKKGLEYSLYAIIMSVLIFSIFATVYAFVKSNKLTTSLNLQFIEEYEPPAIIYVGVGIYPIGCYDFTMYMDFSVLQNLAMGTNCTSMTVLIQYNLSDINLLVEHEDHLSKEGSIAIFMKQLLKVTKLHLSKDNTTDELFFTVFAAKGPSKWLSSEAIYIAMQKIEVTEKQQNFILHPNYSEVEDKMKKLQRSYYEADILSLTLILSDLSYGHVFRMLPSSQSLISMSREDFFYNNVLDNSRITVEQTAVDEISESEIDCNSEVSGNKMGLVICEIMRAKNQTGSHVSEAMYRWFDGYVKIANTEDKFNLFYISTALVAIILSMDRMYVTIKRSGLHTKLARLFSCKCPANKINVR